MKVTMAEWPGLGPSIARLHDLIEVLAPGGDLIGRVLGPDTPRVRSAADLDSHPLCPPILSRAVRYTLNMNRTPCRETNGVLPKILRRSFVDPIERIVRWTPTGVRDLLSRATQRTLLWRSGLERCPSRRGGVATRPPETAASLGGSYRSPHFKTGLQSLSRRRGWREG
jgi:hypothetical protein